MYQGRVSAATSAIPLNSGSDFVSPVVLRLNRYHTATGPQLTTAASGPLAKRPMLRPRKKPYRHQPESRSRTDTANEIIDRVVPSARNGSVTTAAELT